MRITIEIADDKVERLRALAEERGEDGYSRIIDELLEAHLDAACGDLGARKERADRIRRLAGSISDDEAEAWKAEIRESRKRWRTPSSTPTS